MSTQKNQRNPWNGLNSYAEGQRIYGRTDDIRLLSQYILNEVSTVVYGKSGIGKSSIINAGILPLMRQNGMLPVSVRLSHEPDSAPYLLQIQEALLQQLHRLKTEHVDEEGNIVTTLQEGHVYDVLSDEQAPLTPSQLQQQFCPHTLWELLHRYTFSDARGHRLLPLIIFDQFEEIFTLQADRQKRTDFFDQMSDLLNNSMPEELQQQQQQAAPVNGLTASDSAEDPDGLFDGIEFDAADLDIYSYLNTSDFHVVFTIREDFLSYLERKADRTPALKQNRFSLKPINEEQAAEIIMAPVPGLVSQEVAVRIIQDVTGETDFKLDGVGEIPVESAILSLYLTRLYEKRASDDDPITMELVSKFGTNIIDDYYSEAISKVSYETACYLEDVLINKDGRRDNILKSAALDHAVSTEELRVLINEQKLLRQFSYAGQLRIEFIHDTLCPIIVKRRETRKARLQQQENEARMQQVLMEASKARRRNRQRLLLVGTVAMLLVLGVEAWRLLFVSTYSKCYASFTYCNGWPEGVGRPLSKADEQQLVVHYRLTRRGWMREVSVLGMKLGSKNYYTTVECVNAHDELVANVLVSSPLVTLDDVDGGDEQAARFAQMQLQTASWEFLADNEGHMSRITAKDELGQELYAMQFFRADDMNAQGIGNADHGRVQQKALWVNYVDNDGQSLHVLNNGADRMRVQTDEYGHFTSYAFFSSSGTPQPNSLGCFGYHYEVNPSGTIVSRTVTDEFGDELSSTRIDYSNDELGRWIQATEDGFLATAHYDQNSIFFKRAAGTDTLMFSEEGRLTYKSVVHPSDGHRHASMYHKQNRLKLMEQESVGGRFIVSNEYIYSGDTLVDVITDSIRSGRDFYVREHHSYYGDSADVAYYCGSDKTTVENICQPYTYQGYHIIRTIDSRRDGLQLITTKYLDLDGQLTANEDGWAKTVDFYDSLGNLQRQTFFDSSNMPVISHKYYYNDQNQIDGQSVVDVEGNPMRYAELDGNLHLCYYKMKYIMNLDGIYVAIKGENEFGEPSLITQNGMLFNIEVLPTETFNTEPVGGRLTQAIQVARISVSPLENATPVAYLHVRKRPGDHSLPLNNGDLLLVADNWNFEHQGFRQEPIDHALSEHDQRELTVTVARPDVRRDTYDILKLTIPKGVGKIIAYPVYFNEKEMSRLNRALSVAKKKQRQ